MSNTQKKNVPELRFLGFEGEWEEKQLGDIIKVNSGKDYKHLDKGDIPVYGTGGYMTSVSEPLSEIDAVGIGRKGTINKPYLLEAPFWTVDTLFYCTPKKETDILFILSLFRKINWKVYDESTGVPSLSKQTINKINRFVPTNKEQQKIGKFFSKLDRQIELEEQKLELLQQQKKGYMQKIFTQELRFKDENGEEYPEWENKFIKDIFIFENNRRKPITSSLREKGLYPYYGATGIIDYVKDYLFNNEERLLIGEDGAKWGQFETSSFIANGQYWVNNHAHVVKSNDHNLFFMNYYLNFKELRAFVTGNAPAKLTHANLCNINLKIPCLTEQDKVSALLKSIDNKMNNQMNRIELLKERKKGLLQKMFI
ncbi:TPA: restriction endonuclease subunit S [Staphylococcus aureus]|nr:restriction endonuclease subunit S [Staphylococcus aureus]